MSAGVGARLIEHGSAVIVLAPENFEFCDDVVASARIRAGEPLLRKASARSA